MQGLAFASATPEQVPYVISSWRFLTLLKCPLCGHNEASLDHMVWQCHAIYNFVSWNLPSKPQCPLANRLCWPLGNDVDSDRALVRLFCQMRKTCLHHRWIAPDWFDAYLSKWSPFREFVLNTGGHPPVGEGDFLQSEPKHIFLWFHGLSWKPACAVSFAFARRGCFLVGWFIATMRLFCTSYCAYLTPDHTKTALTCVTLRSNPVRWLRVHCSGPLSVSGHRGHAPQQHKICLAERSESKPKAKILQQSFCFS